MRINIIGAGSIGLLYGAKLGLSGAEVTIWTRTREQSDLINRKGVHFIGPNGEVENVMSLTSEWLTGERVIRVDHTSSSWIILAVKQTDINDELLDLIRELTTHAQEGSAIVCIQNGVGHLEKLADSVVGIPVYAAVTTAGAKREDKRTVRYTGDGQLWVSNRAENCSNYDYMDVMSQKLFVDSMQKAGFDVFLSNEINNRIFQKLLINAIINPLTAIFDSTNGELPKHKKRLNVMTALFNETITVLRAAGISLPEDSWLRLLEVCEKTSVNVSSMLSDVRAGRLTEIDAINGAIVRMGEQHHLKTPMNESVIAIIESYELDPKERE
ncbi:2-dehydropantoate 2-reductase [Paenibacillus sp. L3-i20]|nr:2-dehydropantoate 2-reductase [Paenibacillus sp. L3-i20]